MTTPLSYAWPVSKPTGWLPVTNRYGRYPHTDDGVEVRQIFY